MICQALRVTSGDTYWESPPHGRKHANTLVFCAGRRALATGKGALCGHIAYTDRQFKPKRRGGQALWTVSFRQACGADWPAQVWPRAPEL